MNLETQIRQHKVIAILRNVPFEKTYDYADTLFRAGIRLIEVAMNSPDALNQISLIRNKFEGKLTVGAGTAITEKLAKSAVDEGAEFLLTPSSGEDVLRYCADHHIALLPGVMTPTDVQTCLKYGFHTLKLFPANDLPASYIRSLKGPFSDTEYVAVGGVNPGNAVEFLSRGFIGVGIGSGLITSEMIQNNRWEQAYGQIAELVGRIHSL